jgi:uncharacterized repeat protein (TIGR03837 family)
MSHPVTQDSSRKLSPPRPDADLFCRVIDNFGDIGVCWRLARCLARDHGWHVRLWVDALDALAHIKPLGAAEPGVEVRQWNDAPLPCLPAHCVIEAFACDLPPAFVTAMAAQHPPPHWINLEYLSAEAWVEGCHGLPSHDAASGLTKHFFFPGFTARTGGLLRERDLPAQRDAWLADAAARKRDLTLLGMTVDGGALQLSLFGYESPSIATLIEALAAHVQPVQLWVPESRSLTVAAEALGRPLHAGDVVRRGALSLHVLAFMDQDDYDRLLWQCDLNIVRGEDSFVRAQWAARPMLWHIYPQDGGAHLNKLDAFLDRHAEELAAEVATRVRALHRGWNSTTAVPVDDWHALLADLPLLASHARRRAVALASQDDLATQLVMFNQPPI